MEAGATEAMEEPVIIARLSSYVLPGEISQRLRGAGLDRGEHRLAASRHGRHGGGRRVAGVIV